MQKLLRNKWLLGLTVIGILLLVFGAGGGLSGGAGSGNASPPTGAVPVSASPGISAQGAAVQAADAYETELDVQLEHMINQIAGVSGALVMVRVDSTTRQDYGQNVSTSRSTSNEGGQSRATTVTTSAQSQVVTVSGQNGAQTALVTEQELPHITGVLVVARSSDTVQMEAEITNAVQDVLGIPAFEITVLPRR